MTELPRYRLITDCFIPCGEPDQDGGWVKWVDVSSRLQQLDTLLKEIEQHCPCGARPESLKTHPHVLGCAVEKALLLVKS